MGFKRLGIDYQLEDLKKDYEIGIDKAKKPDETVTYDFGDETEQEEEAEAEGYAMAIQEGMKPIPDRLFKHQKTYNLLGTELHCQGETLFITGNL